MGEFFPSSKWAHLLYMTRRSVIVFSSGQSIKTLKLFSEVLPANFCLSRILTDLLKIFDVALLFFGEEFSLVSPDKQAKFFYILLIPSWYLGLIELHIGLF